jgi:hypothetical protein
VATPEALLQHPRDAGNAPPERHHSECAQASTYPSHPAYKESHACRGGLAGGSTCFTVDPPGADRPVSPEGRDPVGQRAERARRGPVPLVALAEALAREVAGARGSLALVTFRLSTRRDATLSAVREAGERFLAVFERRARGAGLVMALDRSAAGRWHWHGVAALPVRLDPEKLRRWWCRLWPRGKPGAWERPARVGQYIRPVAVADLVPVLVHHLRGPRRLDAQPAGVPTTWDRVVACGVLRGPWERAAAGVSLPGAPPTPALASEPPARFKASTFASHPRPRVPEGDCPWCLKPLGRAMATARVHTGCRRARWRALVQVEARTFRAWDPQAGKLVSVPCGAIRRVVGRLEECHWRTVDALRVAAAHLRPDLPPPWPRARERKTWLWNKWARDAWRCPYCGQPKASRLGARTCGRSTCRQARKRRRDAAEDLIHSRARLPPRAR